MYSRKRSRPRITPKTKGRICWVARLSFWWETTCTKMDVSEKGFIRQYLPLFWKKYPICDYLPDRYLWNGRRLLRFALKLAWSPSNYRDWMVDLKAARPEESTNKARPIRRERTLPKYFLWCLIWPDQLARRWAGLSYPSSGPFAAWTVGHRLGGSISL